MLLQVILIRKTLATIYSIPLYLKNSQYFDAFKNAKKICDITGKICTEWIPLARSSKDLSVQSQQYEY